MLWRNPERFKPKSGEYVYVKLPWLEKGGNEWHPFSIYLREATKEGLDSLNLQSSLLQEPGSDGVLSGNNIVDTTNIDALESSAHH